MHRALHLAQQLLSVSPLAMAACGGSSAEVVHVPARHDADATDVDVRVAPDAPAPAVEDAQADAPTDFPEEADVASSMCPLNAPEGACAVEGQECPYNVRRRRGCIKKAICHSSWEYDLSACPVSLDPGCPPSFEELANWPPPVSPIRCIYAEASCESWVQVDPGDGGIRSGWWCEDWALEGGSAPECPSVEPVEGTACASAGTKCTYGPLCNWVWATCAVGRWNVIRNVYC
jgi:hypothetical protein